MCVTAVAGETAVRRFGSLSVGSVLPATAMTPSTRPVLTVDLAAIVANYRILIARTKPAEVSAVVKADGYGLGAKPVARVLARRPGARRSSSRTWKRVSSCAAPCLGCDLRAQRLCAGTQSGVRRLRSDARAFERGAACRLACRFLGRAFALHFDTGMARLGLSPSDVGALECRRGAGDEPSRLVRRLRA